MFKFRLGIIFVGIVTACLYVYFVIVPISKGYIFFTEFAANLVNKQQRVEAIRHTFSQANFLVARRIAYALLVLLIALFAAAIRYSQGLYIYFTRIIHRIYASWTTNFKVVKEISPVAKAILSCTLFYFVAQSIWYMLRLPFTHDEAYTISNFVIPGPLASTTFYPYPNNHILYSICSYPFSFLPIKPEVAFRLPSLIAIVITCLVLFRLLIYFLSAVIASLGIVVFVCMLPVMVYAIFARGYCLVFLFTALSLLSLIKIIQSDTNYHRLWLIVFSVMGLYTIPSYMYPFATVYIVYIIYGVITRRKRLIKNAVFGAAICGVCAVMLYLPVIITTGGWQNFLKVLYVGYNDSHTFYEVTKFTTSVYSIQFFERKSITILFLSLTALSSLPVWIMFFKRKVSLVDKVFVLACLLGFLAPVLSFIVQRKMVAPRTHSYAALFFVGYLFMVLKLTIAERWKMYAYVSTAIVFVAMNTAFAHRHTMLTGGKYFDNTANLFADKMLTHAKPNAMCYTFDMYYLANIQLRHALANEQLNVFQGQQGSPSTAPFNFAANYDWIITANPQTQLSKDSLSTWYVPAVQRGDAILWKKK